MTSEGPVSETGACSSLTRYLCRKVGCHGGSLLSEGALSIFQLASCAANSGNFKLLGPRWMRTSRANLCNWCQGGSQEIPLSSFAKFAKAGLSSDLRTHHITSLSGFSRRSFTSLVGQIMRISHNCSNASFCKLGAPSCLPIHQQS